MTNPVSPQNTLPAGRHRIGKLRAQALAAMQMRAHYKELHRASVERDRKIAWCSSVGPVELLRGMGFLVYFPENHAAMLGAGRKADTAMRRAGQEGYSPDICSYLRADVGAFLEETTPLTLIDEAVTRPPRPDVLVYNTNQCRDIKDWFTWYARKLEVPCIGIESPRDIDDVTAAHVDGITAQLKSLIPPLERIAHARLDPDRLREATALSRQCSELWKHALDTAHRCPSPLSFHMALTLMGPAVVERGTRSAVEFLAALNRELESRIAAAVPAVKNESYRLYWEGMPVWGRLADIHRIFLEQAVGIVASTYCNSWVFDALDENHPLESMARAYTELFIVRSDAAKEQILRDEAERFSVDGIVFHEAKTCPNNSNTRYGMPDRLSRKAGLPVTVLFGDHMDPNCFDEERAAVQIEAFIERLERNR